MSFKNEFNDNRRIIEKRRDTATFHFIKIAASVIGGITIIGLAALPFIWKKPKGKEFTQKLDQEISHLNLLKK